MPIPLDTESARRMSRDKRFVSTVHIEQGKNFFDNTEYRYQLRL